MRQLMTPVACTVYSNGLLDCIEAGAHGPVTHRVHVDEKANGVEKLKQVIANFVEHRSPVAGGCPILNTAIDADDGNPVLRARVAKALRSWVSRLQVIVEQAQEHGETHRGVDAKAVATLIVASLEGALMMSWVQRNDEALRRVQSHLNGYLDREVAVSR